MARNIPGESHAWLELLVIVLHQGAAEPPGISLNQSAIGICAIVQSRDKVGDVIIDRIGLAVSGPSQPKSERDCRNYLPRIIPINLQVMPAAQDSFLMIGLKVATKRQVFHE